jgi:hypothetical protein
MLQTMTSSDLDAIRSRIHRAMLSPFLYTKQFKWLIADGHFQLLQRDGSFPSNERLHKISYALPAATA